MHLQRVPWGVPRAAAVLLDFVTSAAHAQGPDCMLHKLAWDVTEAGSRGGTVKSQLPASDLMRTVEP